jgi:parallel beta-helix repeat protein/predicted outer membrane repeat protein
MEESHRLSRQQRRAAERRRGKGAAASGVALLGMTFAAVPAAQAAVFNVDNLGDAGAGTLRQAITDANTAVGADTIVFQAGLTGTILLTTGQLAISDSVDIQGPGAAVLTVSGNNASRVFYLYNSAMELDVTISGLTITGGNATIGGGIVDFDENLVLDGVTITGNTSSGDGGGLWADGFALDLTISNSVISGNTAGDDGGGIYMEDNGGPVLIQNSVISNNDAAGSGGGIYFYDPDNDITIENSTISGNSAGTTGGGIYFYSADAGSQLIVGTTISGNDAAAGGGVYFYGLDQPFVLENSTISGNQATAGAGGGLFFYGLYGGTVDVRHATISGNSAAGDGGGIYVYTGTLPVNHTIVANNTAGGDADLGTSEGGFDVANSLIEVPSGAVTDNGGNLFSVDPALGPLADNGGPTLTHLPAITSPAVNAGDAAFAPPPATDQRGGPRVVGGHIDIGAVEVNPGTIQLTAALASVGENAGTVTITATRTGGLDGAVSVAYNTSGGSATAGADFLAAAGTLNWANQDGAPKTFQVTIVNDTENEPAETFNAIITDPQGGAALGAITTQVVTIQPDPADLVMSVIDVPTLGDAGKALFALLCALGGFQLLRRRKGLAAPVLAVTLAAGAAQAAEAAKPAAAETRATTVAAVEVHGDQVVIRLGDGTTYEVASADLRLVDRRKGHRGAVVQAVPANQPVVLKVKRKDGKVSKVRVELVDSAAQAQQAVQADPK